MYRATSALFGLICLLLLFSYPTPAAATKYALLIGVSDYSASGLTPLDGTINDIELVRQTLEQDRFGFKGNITVLTNEQATRSGIKNAFAELAGLIKKERVSSVYVHYSGHGSTTPNLNDDDDGQFDETWVSFGSRSKTAQSDDQYDILDDELHEWLLELASLSDELIFVSDSCHSGSVTRGEGMKTRSAGADTREHPLGKNTFRKDPIENAVFLGAAGDHEQAGEYRAEDGQVYGLFTWYWVQALESAKAGETWNDLLKKTSTRVNAQRRMQNPQISGKLADRSVFKGDFKPLPPRVPVASVSKDGKRATIKQGTLAGITSGSVYRLYDPAKGETEMLPTLTIASCQPFHCSGDVAGGALKVNDLIYEEVHAYTIEPIPVYINGGFAEQNDPVLAKLRQQFVDDQMQGYKVVDSARDSRIILYVARPMKTKDGAYSYPETAAVLPKEGITSDPEVWVMDNTMHPWHETLRIPYRDSKKGWIRLQENLRRISRSTELLRLSSAEKPSIAVDVTLWKPGGTCGDGAECLTINTDSYARETTFPLDALEEQAFTRGDLLTFTLTNMGDKANYGYLVNIGPDGEIGAVFPPLNSNEEYAHLDRNQPKKSDMLLLSSGRETVKLLVTQKPIDTRLLESSVYRSSVNITKGGAVATDPLNKLLEDAAWGVTRAKSRPVRPGQWSTDQKTVLVQEK